MKVTLTRTCVLTTICLIMTLSALHLLKKNLFITLVKEMVRQALFRGTIYRDRYQDHCNGVLQRGERLCSTLNTRTGGNL